MYKQNGRVTSSTNISYSPSQINNMCPITVWPNLLALHEFETYSPSLTYFCLKKKEHLKHRIS